MAADPPVPQVPDPKLQAAIDRAEASAKRIADLESEASTAAANANQSLENAKAAAENASSLSGKITSILTDAKTARETATKASTDIPPIVAQITQSSAEIAPILETSKNSRTEVLTLVEAIKTDAAATAQIAKTADVKDKRVTEYETRLQEMKDKYEELFRKLNELLPSATGIGLAKSFHERKKALKGPIRIYFGIFLVSVAGFIAFGFYGLFIEKITSIEEFLRFVLERTPIIVGLVLLEEFSRRQHATTTRLEEDYAYKETISIAFEGYKKAMMEVQESPADSLASKFSMSVIETLHERPGRLLEMEEKQILPLDLIAAIPGTPSADDKKTLNEIYRGLKGAMGGAWIKRAAIVLIVLLIGGAVGYYLASRNIGAHVETSVSVNVPQSPGGSVTK